MNVGTCAAIYSVYACFCPGWSFHNFTYLEFLLFLNTYMIYKRLSRSIWDRLVSSLQITAGSCIVLSITSCLTVGFLVIRRAKTTASTPSLVKRLLESTSQGPSFAIWNPPSAMSSERARIVTCGIQARLSVGRKTPPITTHAAIIRQGRKLSISFWILFANSPTTVPAYRDS